MALRSATARTGAIRVKRFVWLWSACAVARGGRDGGHPSPGIGHPHGRRRRRQRTGRADPGGRRTTWPGRGTDHGHPISPVAVSEISPPVVEQARKTGQVGSRQDCGRGRGSARPGQPRYPCAGTRRCAASWSPCPFRQRFQPFCRPPREISGSGLLQGAVMGVLDRVHPLVRDLQEPVNGDAVLGADGAPDAGPQGVEPAF